MRRVVKDLRHLFENIHDSIIGDFFVWSEFVVIDNHPEMKIVK